MIHVLKRRKVTFIGVLAFLFLIFCIYKYVIRRKASVITTISGTPGLPPRLHSIFRDFAGKIIKVSGDGSCFYHSVLYQISRNYRESQSYDEKRTQVIQFRKAVAASVQKDVWKSVYSDFISYEELQNNLLNYGVWASNIEWKCVSDFLNINILFLRTKTDSVYCGWGFDNLNVQNKIIFIVNSNDNHYDPLILQKHEKNQHAFHYASPKIKHILNQLKSMC